MIQDVCSLSGVIAGASITHFFFFFYSQFCSPGDHRKASPTLKLVLTLTPALIDFQGAAPAGLCKLGRATDRLARAKGPA